MPMNCSGRSVEAASRVIEIDDVLVARIASGFSRRTEVDEDLALDVLLLGRRLDDEIAVAERVERFRRRDVLERRLRVLFLDDVLGDLARHVAVDGREPGLDAVGRDVVERHGKAGERADMGDAVAHLAGADHADFANSVRHGFLSEPLERDDFSSNRHPALDYWWSMIFSENRCPLFGIML